MLRIAADLLEAEQGAVLAANRQDLDRAAVDGAPAASVDRLPLTEARIGQMAEALRAVAALADPVGEVRRGLGAPQRPRGGRVRVPLGVVGVIYENRPNVTSDAAGLCLKAGNAALLRGSASATASNRAIVDALRRALAKAGLPRTPWPSWRTRATRQPWPSCVSRRDRLPHPPRRPALLASMFEHATVPYVFDGDGNCHVYVDAAADLAMAEEIVANAKCPGPGCATRPSPWSSTPPWPTSSFRGSRRPRGGRALG